MHDQAESRFKTKPKYNIEAEYNTEFDTDDQTKSKSKTATNNFGYCNGPLSGQKRKWARTLTK